MRQEDYTLLKNGVEGATPAPVNPVVSAQFSLLLAGFAQPQLLQNEVLWPLLPKRIAL
jgi:hypothetical protein